MGLARIEVNFFRAAFRGDMFYFCDGNSVNNTAIFLLLLSSDYTEPRPAHRLGVHEKGPEGTQPRHLTPTDQKDFPYRVLLR